MPVPEVDFDADISPEEMAVMQAMGIPFLFDTTQVCEDVRSFPGIS